MGGYKTNFSKNLEKKVEIGFYNHDQNLKNKAKLSFVSLHGMDQGRFNWPNAWKKTRWDLYDIGLLPGKKWVRNWKTSSDDSRANPRQGIYEVGWPKSDNIDWLPAKNNKNRVKAKFKLPRNLQLIFVI